MNVPTRIRLVVASVAAVVMAMSLMPATAGAHSGLVRSMPPAGATVDVAPTELVLTFSDPVTVPDGVIRVLDLAGGDVASPTPRVDGPTVRIPLQDSGRGTRVVDWSVISDHSTVVRGAFSYTIGAPTPGARSGSSRSAGGAARREATRMLRSGAGTGLVLATAALLWLTRRTMRRRALHAPTALLTGFAGMTVAAAVAGAAVADGVVMRSWFAAAAIAGCALLVATTWHAPWRVLASLAVFPVVAAIGLASVPAPKSPPDRVEQRVTFDGGTTATVLIDPVVAGLTDVRVDVRSASGAPLATVADASMRYRPTDTSLGDLQLQLVPEGNGRFTASDVLVPFAGEWSFDLVVSEDRFSADLASFEADVQPNEELDR